MLSRVADSFYWMSRYLERAEHSARVHRRAPRASRSTIPPTGRPGAASRSSLPGGDERAGRPAKLRSEAGRSRSTPDAPLGRGRRASSAARERAPDSRADQLRDVGSSSTGCISSSGDGRAVRDRAGEPASSCAQVIEGAHLFHGVTEATLSHGEGWQYMQLGRYIERATATASMLEEYFRSSGADTAGDGSRRCGYVKRVGLLRACAAFEAYCRALHGRHATRAPGGVPAAQRRVSAVGPLRRRSACEDSLRGDRAVARAPGHRPPRTTSPDGSVRRSTTAPIDEIIADSLVRYVESIRKQCEQIHAAVYQTYINYPIETAHRAVGAGTAPDAISRPPSHTVHLHGAGVRERDGAADAAARAAPGSGACGSTSTTSQRARMFAYRDHYGNAVHYFDIPGHHARLDISVESAVEVAAHTELRPDRCRRGVARRRSGVRGGTATSTGCCRAPSRSATPALQQFAGRSASVAQDPLTTVRALNTTIYSQFAYEPRTTRVDSPIDDALRARAGVCQDFRTSCRAGAQVGIPPRTSAATSRRASPDHDRAGDKATHAWVEAPAVPRLGWLRPDATTRHRQRHIAVAIGRDYSDVPPTRGVFKGDAGSELSVAVAVTAGKCTSPCASSHPA